MGTRRPSVEMRVTEYWMSVDRRGPDDCWLWTAYINEDGYGEFFFGGKMVGAHELAVTFSTGETRLPELDTCHSCGNPPCCNPAHLRFDTRQRNVDDMVRMGRNYRPPRMLSDDDIVMIRRRRAAGANQQDLAELYGVSSSFISMIVNGRKRADAGGPILSQRQYSRRTG